MAEREELLTNPPPLHLIHMSICLLSMPLSKDYWCPAFDIWHIMCHNVSSNELTQRRRKKSWLTIPFLCVRPRWYCGCEYYEFTGEVLSDLCRIQHCVICVCVSPHMSTTQEILIMTPCGWAHNPANFITLKCMAITVSPIISQAVAQKWRRNFKIIISLFILLHVNQPWSSDWLTVIIIIVSYTQWMNNSEYIRTLIDITYTCKQLTLQPWGKQNKIYSSIFWQRWYRKLSKSTLRYEQELSNCISIHS